MHGVPALRIMCAVRFSLHLPAHALSSRIPPSTSLPGLLHSPRSLRLGPLSWGHTMVKGKKKGVASPRAKPPLKPKPTPKVNAKQGTAAPANGESDNEEKAPKKADVSVSEIRPSCAYDRVRSYTDGPQSVGITHRNISQAELIQRTQKDILVLQNNHFEARLGHAWVYFMPAVPVAHNTEIRPRHYNPRGLIEGHVSNLVASFKKDSFQNHIAGHMIVVTIDPKSIPPGFKFATNADSPHMPILCLVPSSDGGPAVLYLVEGQHRLAAARLHLAPDFEKYAQTIRDFEALQAMPQNERPGTYHEHLARLELAANDAMTAMQEQGTWVAEILDYGECARV